MPVRQSFICYGTLLVNYLSESNKQTNHKKPKDMKTILILAASILISTAAIADSAAKTKTLTVRDSFGRILTMPMKIEEASDDMPFDTQELFKQINTEKVHQIFDISGMSRPEESEEIPSALQHVIR